MRQYESPCTKHLCSALALQMFWLRGFRPLQQSSTIATCVRPNSSLEPTRYGRYRLAAPGPRCHCPSAAKRHLPPQAAQLER